MAHLTSAAHDHFARQHGVASVGQLLDSGLGLPPDRTTGARRRHRSGPARRLSISQRSPRRTRPLRGGLPAAPRRGRGGPDGGANLGFSATPARPPRRRDRSTGEPTDDQLVGSCLPNGGDPRSRRRRATGRDSHHDQTTHGLRSRSRSRSRRPAVGDRAGDARRTPSRRRSPRGCRRLVVTAASLGQDVPAATRPSHRRRGGGIASGGRRRRGAGRCGGSRARRQYEIDLAIRAPSRSRSTSSRRTTRRSAGSVIGGGMLLRRRSAGRRPVSIASPTSPA